MHRTVAARYVASEDGVLVLRMPVYAEGMFGVVPGILNLNPTLRHPKPGRWIATKAKQGVICLVFETAD